MMGKWKAQSRLLVGGLFLVCFIYVLNSQAINQYVSFVKGQPVTATVEGDLLRKIDEISEQRQVPAINARIDQVWKAIPGYNGLEVNREETIKRMQEIGKWDDQQIVYDEVEPEVGLKDLQPSPIYRGNPQKPMISFMVNVAWGNEYLPEILSTLEKYKIKSTFFLDGSWVSKFPEEAKKIKDAGHEIGNHAYSHPDMKKLSMNRIRLEIEKTNQVIEKEIGIRPDLFAPPSGSFDQRTVELAAQEGMYTILWTLDTIDWKKPAPSTIIKRLTPQLANGTTILMHPTASSAAALPELIKAAKVKGLQMGTVSDLISTKRVQSIE